MLAGEVRSLDVHQPHADGERIIDVTLVPHRGERLVLGFFILGHDITERRTRETGARRTERLVALGTLAAGIAHEINNPAASILAASDLARSMLDTGDLAELEPILGGIAAEAERCGAIVRGILRFASDQSAGRDPADLGTVVERAATLVRGETALSGAAVHLDLAAGLPSVAINTTEILQVVLNLVTNALRAGATDVWLRTGRGADTVTVTVRDNGRGMSTAEAARIFDPFYTTHRTRGGVGLGLSVSHAIVAGHGGQIRVDSTPGAGTTMTIELPSHPATA